jgi:hypothetical protein
VDSTGRTNDTVIEIEFGSVVTDMSQVAPLVRRAQIALLNPSIAPRRFLEMTEDILDQRVPDALQFSRNVVCVNLEGPQLVDVTFIEVPSAVAASHITLLIDSL